MIYDSWKWDRRAYCLEGLISRLLLRKPAPEQHAFWKAAAEQNLDMANKYMMQALAYRTALESIANNTCCDACREAAKVAAAALSPRAITASTLGQTANTTEDVK